MKRVTYPARAHQRITTPTCGVVHCRTYRACFLARCARNLRAVQPVVPSCRTSPRFRDLHPLATLSRAPQGFFQCSGLPIIARSRVSWPILHGLTWFPAGFPVVRWLTSCRNRSALPRKVRIAATSTKVQCLEPGDVVALCACRRRVYRQSLRWRRLGALRFLLLHAF